MEVLWNKVLTELQIEVSQAVYITLFKNTSLVTIEDNVATVATPSPIVTNLIEKRYYTLLQNKLKQYIGKDVSVVFTERSLSSQEKNVTSLPLFDNTSSSASMLLKKARLRSGFTFEKFAVSPTNQLAYTAATTVAGELGKSYNPLFFHGSVGVGKTHLMQAIGGRVLELHPNKKTVYLTSEEFTNEFIESIRGKTTSAFRRRFRNVDLLLLDDVQFLAGKEKVQEELFHTFNSLVSDERQVVLCSDRHPMELEKIQPRLKSRFSGGLTVDVAPPDMELRCAILLIKASNKNVDLPIDIAKRIASEVEDTRRLEGTLNRFISEFSQNEGEDPEELIARVVSKTTKTNGYVERKVVSVEEVLSAVCAFYQIKPTQLKGPKRDRFLVTPRHVAMYLLKTELSKTLDDIGNVLGGRDHTTVMYGVSKIEMEISTTTKTSGEILRIKRSLWG